MFKKFRLKGTVCSKITRSFQITRVNLGSGDMFLRPLNCYQIRPSNPLHNVCSIIWQSHDQTQTTAETVTHFTVGRRMVLPLGILGTETKTQTDRDGPRNEGAASVDCLFALWTETTQANAVEAGKKQNKV